MEYWRFKFGKIDPSVWNHGSEFRKMLPDGSELFISTLGVTALQREDLTTAFDEILSAARLLDDRAVDCIVSGGDAIYSLQGMEVEEELISRANQELEAPFTTSLRAHVDALRALEANSLLVVTPYPEERNKERRGYLEDRGFDVVAIGGVQLTNSVEIQQQDAATTYRLTKNLSTDLDDDFDAVYIPCAEWNCASQINAMEADIGRPVVTSAQAQIWKGFKLARINPAIEGYGELFSV